MRESGGLVINGFPPHLRLAPNIIVDQDQRQADAGAIAFAAVVKHAYVRPVSRVEIRVHFCATQYEVQFFALSALSSLSFSLSTFIHQNAIESISSARSPFLKREKTGCV